MGQIIAAFLAVTFLFVGCSGDGVLDSSENPSPSPPSEADSPKSKSAIGTPNPKRIS